MPSPISDTVMPIQSRAKGRRLSGTRIPIRRAPEDRDPSLTPPGDIGTAGRSVGPPAVPRPVTAARAPCRSPPSVVGVLPLGEVDKLDVGRLIRVLLQDRPGMLSVCGAAPQAGAR